MTQSVNRRQSYLYDRITEIILQQRRIIPKIDKTRIIKNLISMMQELLDFIICGF
jgi:hypothetical protein